MQRTVPPLAEADSPGGRTGRCSRRDASYYYLSLMTRRDACSVTALRKEGGGPSCLHYACGSPSSSSAWRGVGGVGGRAKLKSKACCRITTAPAMIRFTTNSSWGLRIVLRTQAGFWRRTTHAYGVMSGRVVLSLFHHLLSFDAVELVQSDARRISVRGGTTILT